MSAHSSKPPPNEAPKPTSLAALQRENEALRSQLAAAKAQLLATQTRDRVLLEALGEAILVTDGQGHILDLNEGAERIFGYRKGELLGQNLHTLLEAPGLGPSEQQAARGEALGIHRDGHRFPVVAGFGTWVEGEHKRCSVFVQDLTKRRAAELALQQSEQRFRQIADVLEDVLYLMEPDHTISYISPAYERVWGHPPDEVVRNRAEWLNHVHPEDLQRVTEAHVRALEGGHFEQEYRILRADETVRWIRDRVYVSRNDQGAIERYIGISEDVTETRELENALQHAQKMEAVGTLASGVAHDFRNLLQGIRGCAHMALRAKTTPERTQLYLNEIVQATQHGASLTDHLMAFSHRKDLQVRPSVLDDVLEHATTLISRLVGDHITLQLDLHCTGLHIMADPIQLEQVLLNLAANAADAMPTGGSLTFATALASSHEPNTPDHLRLTVQDTGLGMDPDTAKRAFEPFFTTKGPGKGTGLGLSTVHALTTKLGGRVYLESSPGHGTRFTFDFPICPARQPGDAPPNTRPTHSTRQRPDPKAGEATILLVEDNEAARIAIADFLREEGYQVLDSSHPHDALSLAQHHPRPVDLLLTDLALPEMDGEALYGDLAKKQPALSVVFMSGLPDRLRGEQYTYLEKPIDLDHLLQTIEQSLTA